MKTIKIKRECNIKGKKYEVGDVFKPTKDDMPIVCRLNENGFIEPLTKEELIEISNNFKPKKKKKEEI